MELFKPGVVYDFMRLRRTNLTISGLSTLVAIGLFVFPGPRWGLDFKGGTEIELAFDRGVQVAEVRGTLRQIGYGSADVLSVEGRPGQYILRVDAVSTLTPETKERIRSRLRQGFQGFRAGVQETKFSPGGDKVTLRLSDAVDPGALRAALEEGGASVRESGCVRFGQSADHRYECALVGVADEIVAKIRGAMGDRAPEAALRVEWVGPKAGAQLRDAAIKSLFFAIAFIMGYVAFRFDLRFAPGGVVAMVHDAILTAGILVLLRKEFTLTTVAALLTIVGYSINDTIVVYDRIRENLGRLRGMSMAQIINVSTSQTLSRTVLTGATTLVSILAFFIWGTPVIRDFALTMFIGILIGTYSSIYVAAPITEWLDRRYFATAAAKARGANASGKGGGRGGRGGGAREGRDRADDGGAALAK
jgi:preprotein translocase subunit SecF